MGRLHIIITGEQGTGRAFTVRKKTLRNIAVVTFSVALLLTVGTLAGIRYFNNYRLMQARAHTLDIQLEQTKNVLNLVNSEKEQLTTQYTKEINRLDERSRIIRTIMDDIGIDLPEDEEDADHSGGPFIEYKEDYTEKLIYRADQYLDILRTLPLGRPVPGKISSKFGNRTDPLRKKKAFHPGIDFRGNTGDEIRATGDAIVEKASRNKVMGRYIILSHGNGFETIYAHMHKTLVSKGDKVTRGQVIGQIGNTGRSTGSHLHYGIKYNGKSINPMKYLKVASLSIPLKQ